MTTLPPSLPLSPVVTYLEVVMHDVVVKVDIGPLLVLIAGDGGFSEPLEPCIVVLMEPPRLTLELVSRQILREGRVRGA